MSKVIPSVVVGASVVVGSAVVVGSSVVVGSTVVVGGSVDGYPSVVVTPKLKGGHKILHCLSPYFKFEHKTFKK